MLTDGLTHGARLYSYVVRYDFGFAPNPFHGWCTLATCKPDIRGRARPGDVVMGTGSAQRGAQGCLVYAMVVDEVLPFDDYWRDGRFLRKRPRTDAALKHVYGDNIYHRDEVGCWVQADSRHSIDAVTPNPSHVRTDTRNNAVLAGQDFVYFGGAGPVVPPEFRTPDDLDAVHSGRGYRVGFTQARKAAIAEWLTTLGSGVRGDPSDWAGIDA